MDDAVLWYHRMMGLIAEGKLAYNTVVAKSTGRVVGGALLRDIDGDAGKLEVGYLLGRAHWGQGLMREAVEALVGHALTSPKIRRVEARLDARNAASRRLLESLGFQREALLRDYWLNKGEAADFLVYGALRREWIKEHA